jgi:hypothetical protein
MPMAFFCIFILLADPHVCSIIIKIANKKFAKIYFLKIVCLLNLGFTTNKLEFFVCLLSLRFKSRCFFVLFTCSVLFGFGSGNRTLIDLFCSVWAERQNTASVGH